MSADTPRDVPILDIPDTVEDRKLWLEKVAVWSALADPSALKTLHLGERYKSSYAPPAHKGNPQSRNDYQRCEAFCEHFAWEKRRERPLSFSELNTQLRITGEILTGEDLHSQVYSAVFDHENGTTSDDVELAVKVYQTSLVPIIFGESRFEALCNNKILCETELLDFRTEEWVYRQLEPLQGYTLPYVYGFFHILLPHGEPCVALVMEKIESIDPRKVKQCAVAALPSEQDALKTVADALLAASHLMHTFNLASLDLTRRNILWPVGTFEAMSPTAVFIDFGIVEPLRQSLQRGNLADIVAALGGYGFTVGDIKIWLHAVVRPGSIVAKIFDVLDEKVPEFCERNIRRLA
ncbi:hypothetical protein EXIGLDRAFT_836325 [Exidia glandulosa HHB12029]|uniref:Protein kinase domain-containing protein n=1 Tax=Exidia glandulosa HHB12029 TaxID=1314781 RepID=A0A165HY83_EXIGL|nr:hypothetical protein EXIGLDRAFT_836325 [Exidia glandulosa HHB12029]